MKPTKYGIIASLLATLTVFSCVSAHAQAATEMQTTSIDECATDLENCATNIKNIYISRYPDEAEMIVDIVDTISASEEFVNCFENEGATAFQIIEDSLRDALTPTVATCSLSNGMYSSRYLVPTIEQSEIWYCGPASVLQALIGNGVLSNRTSNKSATKQDSVAASLNTTEDGTYITNISAYMRQQFPAAGGYEYKAKAFTCYTYQNAIEMVKTSLQQNAVPIIRVDDTSVLGYYDGEQFTHYMCISKVNTVNNTVTVVDPHKKDAYRGTHTISMAEFEDLVNYDGWIALYTNAEDGYYVYE